jgi:SRSO17 transposase
MGYELDADGRCRLDGYFAEIGIALQNKRRREAFGIYPLGLLSNLERKSVEPTAAAACGNPASCDAYHQKLLYLSANAPWDNRALRLVAAPHAIGAMSTRKPVTTWIVNDTVFSSKERTRWACSGRTRGRQGRSPTARSG